MLTLTIATLIALSPAPDEYECPHSVLCQSTAWQRYVETYNDGNVKRPPAFPGDLVVCEDDERPGHDCNCVGADEDMCKPVPWQSCGGDMDCEIKIRSPYGWKPGRRI